MDGEFYLFFSFFFFSLRMMMCCSMSLYDLLCMHIFLPDVEFYNENGLMVALMRRTEIYHKR